LQKEKKRKILHYIYIKQNYQVGSLINSVCRYKKQNTLVHVRIENMSHGFVSLLC